MREGWEYVDLSDAVEKGSSNISLKKIADDNGEFPVYGAKGFAKSISYFQQEKEYLAIIKDGAGIGRLSKHPAKSSVLATLQYLIPKDGYHIDFVKYFLLRVDFEKYRVGSTIPHIYWKHYKTEKIPALPLAEQKRIVAVLDEAFAGIKAAAEAARKNLASARELFETTLNATFTQKGEGWVETTLGEVCERFEYGTSSKSQKTGRVPVLRMGNIQNRELDWEKLVFTDDVSDIEKHALKEGDVLFNRTNSPELVGKSAIFRETRPAIFAGYLIRIHRTEHRINAEFLNYYLNSPSARDYGKTVMSGSVNQANISGSKLKLYPISIPADLSEQVRLVRVLNTLSTQTQALEALYQRKLDALEELKQSLLQKAFAGELTHTQEDAA